RADLDERPIARADALAEDGGQLSGVIAAMAFERGQLEVVHAFRMDDPDAEADQAEQRNRDAVNSGAPADGMRDVVEVGAHRERRQHDRQAGGEHAPIHGPSLPSRPGGCRTAPPGWPAYRCRSARPG